jgi:hypothetical protein
VTCASRLRSTEARQLKPLTDAAHRQLKSTNCELSIPQYTHGRAGRQTAGSKHSFQSRSSANMGSKHTTPHHRSAFTGAMQRNLHASNFVIERSSYRPIIWRFSGPTLNRGQAESDLRTCPFVRPSVAVGCRSFRYHQIFCILQPDHARAPAQS